MKAYGGMDILIHIFLTSALGEGEWSNSRSGRFILGRGVPVLHWIGGWMNPRADLDSLDDVENILDPTKIRTPTPGSRSP
jgi:hypothetical protein